MNDLPINRRLDERTRKQAVMVGLPGKGGKIFSLHILRNEVIITDNRDYTKIYAIYSLEYYRMLEQEAME